MKTSTLQSVCASATALTLAVTISACSPTEPATPSATNTQAVTAVDSDSDDSRESETGTTKQAEPQTTIELSSQGSKADSDSVEIDGSSITITSGGTYELKGELSSGQLNLKPGALEEITLILNGVNISNPAGPAIAIWQGASIKILVAEGTSNKLSDGDDYDLDDRLPEAALASVAPLHFSGGGNLEILGNEEDAIKSLGAIVIDSGTYHLHAEDNAISSPQAITLNGSTIYVFTDDDAFDSPQLNLQGGDIKTNQHEDED